MYDSFRSSEAELTDTVAHLQVEVEALKSAGSAGYIPVAFTSTKVPKFSGETNWDQYRQVFDRPVEWVGRRYGRPTTLVSSGGGRIKRRPVGARGEKGHAGWTS